MNKRISKPKNVKCFLCGKRRYRYSIDGKKVSTLPMYEHVNVCRIPNVLYFCSKKCRSTWGRLL